MKRYKMSYSNGMLSESTSQGGKNGKDGKDGLPGAGFKLTPAGNFDLQGKRLTNVAAGTGNSDSVTKYQVETIKNQLKADFLQVDGSSHMTGDLDLRGNKLILPGEINMNRKLIKNLDVDESDDFSAVNMATLKKHSASVGDIDLQEKFNVLNSKQRNLSELKTHYDSLVSFEEVKQNFLSLKETFPMRATLDMNNNSILKLKEPTLGNEPATKNYADKKLSKTGGTLTGAINMGKKKITNLGTPTANTDAATKGYADSQAFSGNMGNSKITNLGTPTANTDAATKAYADTKVFSGNMGNSKITNLGTPTANTDAATKGYVDTEDAKHLSKTGGTMTGAINMGTSKITNLGTPTANSDAATKDFVEKSHVSQSGLQQNAFLFQMTDVNESSSESNITVKGISTFSNTPHTLFKKAYNFTIGKSALNEYNARIGFNFYPVFTGEYTYVVEYFPPTLTNVSVDCRSTPLNVNKQIFKKFPTFVKNIVQIHKWQNTTPCYLMVDIKSDGDASSPAKGEGWMIVYGIEGTHNDVPSNILDTPFTISGGDMLLQVPINMNKKTIENLPPPTETTQAATKGYVDISGIFSILEHATATFVDGYIKQNAECFYSVERGTKEEIFYNSSTKAISTLFDQTLSGLNATQSTVARRPKLSTTKNAKRFFFTFDGTKRMLSSIDLNPATGANDIVHVFILFRLTTHAGSNANFRNGLFGHDNGGWDKFVSFNPLSSNSLIISGTTNQKRVEVGGNDWKTKANASELNKWCCLSIHWDVPAGAKKSSCWVNGKKVKNFTSRTSQGSTQMTFGDLDPNGLAGLKGDIQLFLLYKGWGMSDLIVKAHHKMICERFGVDHDAITFP